MVPDDLGGRVICLKCWQEFHVATPQAPVPAPQASQAGKDGTVIRFRCSKCDKRIKAFARRAGRKTACPRCGQRLLIPSPARNRTLLGEARTGLNVKGVADEEATTEGVLNTFSRHIFKIAGTVIGLIAGPVVGYYSAHYFAIYGGFLLLGVPHSPARDQLVPGHVLLWTVIMCLVGFGLGLLLDLFSEVVRNNRLPRL